MSSDALILTPKNWDDFQHYKTRNPPWIKLHKSLIDNYEFQCLPVASKALAPSLWLLASEYQGGSIMLALPALAFRLRMSESDLINAIKPLIEKGFIIDASNMLATCLQDACLETEAETETETETEIKKKKHHLQKKQSSVSSWPNGYAELFWQKYPHKVGKATAVKSLARVRAGGKIDFETIMSGLDRYIAKADDRPWCNPATWINQGRWEDAPAVPSTVRPRTISEQRHQEVRNALDRLEAFSDQSEIFDEPERGATDEI